MLREYAAGKDFNPVPRQSIGRGLAGDLKALVHGPQGGFAGSAKKKVAENILQACTNLAAVKMVFGIKEVASVNEQAFGAMAPCCEIQLFRQTEKPEADQAVQAPGAAATETKQHIGVGALQ